MLYAVKVQASAGAMKLLQAELVERKGVSEVSREGQMEARERLIKELEGSARRAQQVGVSTPVFLLDNSTTFLFYR